MEIDDLIKNSKEKSFVLAKNVLSNYDFFNTRLSYETIVLQRDLANKKIIWERKICGFLLKSTFDDNLPENITIVGADQIDSLGTAIFDNDQIALIGNYEFQGYFLEKFSYKPLYEATLDNFIEDNVVFLDQKGEQLSTKKFIELFSMTVFSKYMALREENYLATEIKINVGRDGSLIRVESTINGNILFHCPAIIDNEYIQHKIIESLNKIFEKFENNSLDQVALQQARARNNHNINRAIIRRQAKLYKHS